MLAELVHEPLADGLARRLAPAAGSGAAPVPTWHTRFTKLALELIAVTSGAGEPTPSCTISQRSGSFLMSSSVNPAANLTWQAAQTVDTGRKVHCIFMAYADPL